MEQCDASFKKRVRIKCYDALEGAGFTRFAKQGADLPLSSDFHVWVGLNTGLYHDRVDLVPFIGVHAPILMKMCAKLEGRKYDRGVATYAVALGELEGARDEYAFAFGPSQSEGFMDAEARRLAHLYATVGLDYARSIASYEALLPLLEGRLDMLGGYPESVTCCLYLMGRVGEARLFAQDFLAQRPDYFSAFGKPFLKMVDEQGT